MIWILQTALAGPCTAALLVDAPVEDRGMFTALGRTETEAEDLAWEKACITKGLPCGALPDGPVEGYLPSVWMDEIWDGRQPAFEATLVLDPLPHVYEATSERGTTTASCLAAYEDTCLEAGLEPQCVEDGSALRVIFSSDKGTELREAGADARASLPYHRVRRSR